MSGANLFSTDQFIAPAYGAGCFADIPALLRHTLTGAEPSA